MSDIVDDIFLRIKNVLGNDFDGEILLKIEKEEINIRQDWSGTTAYVTKHKLKEEKRKKVDEEIKNGVPVKIIARNTGMSRGHIYRLLKSNK